MPCDDLEGGMEKGGQEGGDLYVHTAETNNIVKQLYSFFFLKEVAQ